MTQTFLTTFCRCVPEYGAFCAYGPHAPRVRTRGANAGRVSLHFGVPGLKSARLRELPQGAHGRGVYTLGANATSL
jgi:hypothetical protein